MLANHRHIVLIVSLLLAFSCSAWSQKQRRFDVPTTLTTQQPVKKTPAQKTQTSAPKKSTNSSSQSTPKTASQGQRTMVYLENAQTFSFDESVNSEAQLLKGNVRFRHDDVFLYCDSAYFFDKRNSFNAYGHVKIVQGDTLFIFGDVLYYDGDTKMARLRHNVRMTDRKITLVTDSLNYDRIANVGYYYTGGKLYDAENVLTSVFGYYYPGWEMAMFRDSVLLTNPGFTMRADTLKYYTETAVAEMVGPTTILYENETTIYSELGQYDTHTEQSRLYLNSWVRHIDGEMLTGDTIFYDKKNGEGRAFSHVHLNDSANQISLYGNFVYYKEDGDIALAYDSALMVEHSSPDTLYMNADTLRAYAIDSVNKFVRAYHHVRLFRTDVQAVCDSACFSTRDSIIHLMQLPVAWSGSRQITGDTMRIYSLNGAPERMHVIGAAFVAEQQDSIHFNQLSGKEIIAYLSDNELRCVEVRGNAESRFFPLDDDSLIIGLNQTTSSYLTAYLVDQKIERIVLYPSPEGTLTPLDQASDDLLRLPGFTWQQSIRPLVWRDVFARPERSKSDTPTKRRRSGRVDPSETETETASTDKDKKSSSKRNSDSPSSYSDFGSDSGSSRSSLNLGGGGNKGQLQKKSGR